MAGQEDALRFAVEAVDKFSGPLREMTKSFHQFQDAVKFGQEKLGKDTKLQIEQQKLLNEEFTRTANKITGFMTPAMGALGLSVGGVGAALGKMIEKLKEAGDAFYSMQGAMARTGLSEADVEAYSRVIARIAHISVDAARDQLAGVGDIAAQLSRNLSPTVQALEGTFGNLHELVAKMGSENAPDAVKDFFAYYESHPAPPDQQRKLLKAFGLDPNLANATADQIKEYIEDQQASFAAHPPIALKTMEQLDDAFDDLQTTLREMNDDFLNAFGGTGADAISAIGRQLHQEVEDAEYLAEVLGKIYDWLQKLGSFGKDPFAAILHPPTQSWTDMLEKPPEALPAWSELFSNPRHFFGGGGGDSFADRFGAIGGDKGKTPGIPGRPGGPVPPLHLGAGGDSFKSRFDAINGGGSAEGPIGTGKFDRLDFAEEIASNPALAERLQTIVQGEVGHEASRDRQMVQLETIFNRARARGQSLAEVTQQYTGPGSRGYYPASTFSGGRIKSLAEYQAFQRDIMAPVVAGSDVSTERLGFPATGNASDQPGNEVASHGIASGKYTRHKMLGPETYVQEGHGIEDEARLERSRVARDLISAPQKVEGDAHLRVAFENAPAGAKAYMKYGGMFKSGTVDWGHPMPASPPGGEGANFSDRWPGGG